MTAQARLFDAPVDERCLSDAERTILEAIDRKGPITANEAGRIVYWLRGYRNVAFVRRAWVTSAGIWALEKLELAELVRRSRGGRWVRVEGSRSSLIGLYVVETSISTSKTRKLLKVFARRLHFDRTSRSAHTHDTSANRHFLGVSEPVTSSHRSSAATRSAEIYGSGRTTGPRRRSRIVL